MRLTVHLAVACIISAETVLSFPGNPNAQSSEPEMPVLAHSYVPVRMVTRGPLYHWFAYYDKLAFDPTSRYTLAMEVDFEDRMPEADDSITVGMVDLEDRDRWIPLGKSRAWGWQQGCMLQWRPASADEVMWNDREGDRFVCRIKNVRTEAARTVPYALYTMSPDGSWGLSLDFERVDDMRPGYGYAGIADRNVDVFAPDDMGIYRVDIESGRGELIVTIADVAAIPYPNGDISAAKHYFNHLLISPDGKRFIFLHRWRMPGETRWSTRMLTAAADGSDIRVVDDNGLTSHFIWWDGSTILAWSRQPSHGQRFYLFDDDGSGGIEPIGVDEMTRDGHCTILPGGEWILNDTYPDGERMQDVYLYHVPTGRKVTLARFRLPEEYRGELRIDIHPRFSPDGRYVTVDAAHEGYGRQVYLLDIGRIVSK